MLETPALHPSRLPTTLGGQLRRQSPRYAWGFLLLAAYQYAQFWFDTHLSEAIDSATHGRAAAASRLGAALIAVAISSLVLRVLSRMTLFSSLGHWLALAATPKKLESTITAHHLLFM